MTEQKQSKSTAEACERTVVVLWIEPASNLVILDSSDNIDMGILAQDMYFVYLSGDRDKKHYDLAF